MTSLNKTDCPSIDSFRNHVYTSVYSVITVVGLVGNGFALVVLLRTYQRRSPFQVYMLNLAVSDLLCISTLPLRVFYYFNEGHWTMGDTMCRISAYAFYVNIYGSILFMAAMSVTRFLAIVFPMQNRWLVTDFRSRLVCVCVWTFVCSASSPFLMSGQYLDPQTNKTKCLEPPQGKAVTKVIILSYFSMVVGFIIPFLVILVCYVGIIRTLLSRNTSVQHKQGADARAIRMIAIVMLTFLVSYMPYHVQRSVHLSFLSQDNASCEKRVAMQKSVVVTLCLAASNSCFDPLLYFFAGEGFRTRISSMRRSRRAREARGANVDHGTERGRHGTKHERGHDALGNEMLHLKGLS